jgi:hypothetical protein
MRSRWRLRAAGKDGHVVCRVSKRCLVRSVVVLLALGGAGRLTWRALRLPHASDDWVHSDTAQR